MLLARRCWLLRWLVLSLLVVQLEERRPRVALSPQLVAQPVVEVLLAALVPLVVRVADPVRLARAAAALLAVRPKTA